MGRAEYFRDYYAKHRAEINQHHKEWKRAHRKSATAEPAYLRNKEFIRQQKAGAVCNRCHIETDPQKLLFHHVDPTTKLFGVGNYSGRALQALIDEIAKCVIMCRVCHRAHHKLGRYMHRTDERTFAALVLPRVRDS